MLKAERKTHMPTMMDSTALTDFQVGMCQGKIDRRKLAVEQGISHSKQQFHKTNIDHLFA